jgi:uncharacterized protein (TIGR03083 family)
MTRTFSRGRIDRGRVFAAAADERHRIAGLVDDLDEAQLATPSLCAGWDIKTVAAHLVSTLTDGVGGFVCLALRRGTLRHAIDELAQRWAQLPATEIVANLRQYADRPMSPPVLGPLDPLTDVLVHGGDIRIPLGLPFEPDPERVALAIDFLTGLWPFGFVPMGRLRGIRLRGTDIGQTWGKGAEVLGPAVALMMAAAGRTALLEELEGPGLPVLGHRLAR